MVFFGRRDRWLALGACGLLTAIVELCRAKPSLNAMMAGVGLVLVEDRRCGMVKENQLVGMDLGGLRRCSSTW